MGHGYVNCAIDMSMVGWYLKVKDIYVFLPKIRFKAYGIIISLHGIQSQAHEIGI